MIVKIFWKETCQQCPGCPEAKELAGQLEKEKIKTELVDTESEAGAVDAKNYQIFSTPSVLVAREDDGSVINLWEGETPSAAAVKYYLSI